MTEQERNVLLNELRQQESQREKQIKRERFRRLNPYVKKGAVVFAGSNLRSVLVKPVRFTIGCVDR